MPRAVNTEAYSQATAPPPITAMLPNGRSISKTVVESWTSWPSKGRSGGRNGRDPVAIKTTSPLSTRS